MFNNENQKNEENNKGNTLDPVKSIKEILHKQIQANKQQSNSNVVTVSEINQPTTQVNNSNYNTKLEKFSFSVLTNNEDIKYLNFNNIANFIIAYPKSIEIKPLILRNLNEKINYKPKAQTLVRSQN